MRTRIARVWFGLTALVVAAGLAAQLAATAGNGAGVFDSPVERVLNVFAYFTVESNLIVGITGLLLAVRSHRPSLAFRTAYLTGVLAITVTGAVYHAVLAGLQVLTGLAAFADTLLHTVVPLLGVVGWLAFAPRGAVTPRVAALTLVFPLCWLAFTLARGVLVGFYPYPFLDVAALGYGRALLNCLLVGVLFAALAAGAAVLDRVLPPRSDESGYLRPH